MLEDGLCFKGIGVSLCAVLVEGYYILRERLDSFKIDWDLYSILIFSSSNFCSTLILNHRESKIS